MQADAAVPPQSFDHGGFDQDQVMLVKK